MSGKNTRFDDWLAEQMEDPQFVAEMEKTEAGYEVERLRIGRGLTKAQLAELVGSGVGRIARLESGETSPQINFLREVVRAMGGDLRITVSDVGSRLSGEISGVGKRYARLLVRAGITSVSDLAEEAPAELREKLAQVNGKTRLVARVPGQTTVSGWIEQARRMPSDGGAVA